MDDQLKSVFRKEEIELAASIGAQSTPLQDRVLQFFQEMPDPLVPQASVHELLACAESLEDVGGCLTQLEEAKALESSVKTLRPLDPEGVRLYRRSGVPFARLRLIALESQLEDGTSTFQFACDGRLIRSLACVDRLDAIAGKGHQRAEIRKHVDEIADGIRGGTQIPNSILLVLVADRVSEGGEEGVPASFIIVRPATDFVEMPSPTYGTVQRVRTVELDFPFRRASFDDEKSVLLVDGQQRTAALSLVDVDAVPSFTLTVNALVADAERAKRVFQVANSTVKIATQFSRALLASMEEAPGYLRVERTRALACRILALQDATSPFHGLVQYPGSKQAAHPVIAYNSLFQVVSAFADSALPVAENPEELARVVSRSFALVKDTWPTAWGKKPTDSRLMHGVGLRSTAGLLSAKLEGYYEKFPDLESPGLWGEIAASLKRLQPRVVWTDQDAAGASTAVRKIFRDEIAGAQNTNQDISALTSWLKKESLSLDSKARKDSHEGE